MDSVVKAPSAGDLVKDATLKTFKDDVLKASMAVPVLVDFWAPWCGPCKTLGPQLEKIVQAAGGKVKLVKVNIDEPQNQPLAQQLRIQSIPAVYAFHKGQPIDGFVGALPESQLKQFVQSLIGDSLAPDPVEQLLEHGRAALDQGDADTALQAFGAALQEDPANLGAHIGLIRALIAKGMIEEARTALAKVPAEHQNHADVQAMKSAIELAASAHQAAGQLGEAEARVKANPADHQARLDYATALLGAGERERATDELLDLVRRDRKWNEEAARKQLVQLFETWGPTDPLTIETRKRLSSVLFS